MELKGGGAGGVEPVLVKFPAKVGGQPVLPVNWLSGMCYWKADL